MISSRPPRQYLAQRRAHCASGNTSNAGKAVVKARGRCGSRWRSPKRLTACAIRRDSFGASRTTDATSGLGGLGRLALSTELTKVPEPVCDSTKPSATSRSNTSMMVVRDKPSSIASVRLAGKRSPGLNPPSRIMARSATQSWVLTGWRAPRSMVIDNSNEPPARLTIPSFATMRANGITHCSKWTCGPVQFRATISA